MYAKTDDGKSLLVRDIVKEKPTIHKAIVEKLPGLMDDGVINKELLIAVYNDLFKLMHDNVVLVDTDENVTLCPVCKKIIVKVQINGRGTYYCEKCQNN